MLRHFFRSNAKLFEAVASSRASAKGLKTTAEGVETAEVADLLAQIGCDELQGYHFGRPAGFAETDARLRGAAP